MFAIVAAIGKCGELGANGTMLWHLKEDMKYFKQLTLNHTVVMGRKTFESLPNGPLKDRNNIVITKDKSFAYKGVTVISDLNSYISDNIDSDETIYIIGGGKIYSQFMPYSQKMFITHIDAKFDEADTFFYTPAFSHFSKKVLYGGTEGGISYQHVEYTKI